MSELEFVRKELKKAQKAKQWQEIVKVTGLTRTTFYSIVKDEHIPNGLTISLLHSYFTKRNKK